MKYLLFTLFGVLNFLASSQAQKGHNISFEIENYSNDTLIVGHYYANRHMVEDTLYADKKGKFTMKGDESLEDGSYLVLLRPDNKYFQFMVNEDDQDFKVKVDAENFGSIKFKGSEDNDRFYEYMDFIAGMKSKANTLKEKKKLLEEENKDVSEIVRKLDKFDSEVKDYQNNIISKHPESMSAVLIQGNLNVDIPEFEGTEREIKEQNYDYYRAHFFDHIDLGNPANLRMPFLHTRIETYVNDLTPQVPDSIIRALDYILHKMMPAEDTYHFYLGHFTNKMSASKVVGHDAIFVHLVDNYYSKGLAPWSSEETLNKLKDSSRRLRPVLIGKTVPDITLFKEDGSPYKLSDVHTDYTVMMFWAPDCGHCKKSMPDAVSFNEKYKDKNVTFLAVCTKQGEKHATCWEGLEEKNMQDFVLLSDEYGKSRFKRKFDVRTTPKIFILDKKREILIKGIGTKQLDEIMEFIIKNDKEEEEKGKE